MQYKLDCYEEPNTWDIEKLDLEHLEYTMWPEDTEITIKLDNNLKIYFYI